MKGKIDSSGRLYPSKMWATEDLAGMFSAMAGSVFIKRNEEVLYLKNENKEPMNYRDSVKTRKFRRQVSDFNEMLSSLDIQFKVNYADLSDREAERVGKVGKLVSLVETGGIWLDTLDGVPLHRYYRDIDSYTDGSEDNSTDRGVGNGIDSEVGKGTERSVHTTHSLSHLKYYNISDHDAFLSNIFNGIELYGSVKPESNFMRRIFNVDWFHGGRFYQAPHITIPSACRKTMLINGEPTVEPDYSGQHIRMLYNLLGIDYRDECYVYKKADTANKADRDRIKLASLIIINAEGRRSALEGYL